MPLERLHKVLAHAGFGSRRSCEKRIAAGEVQVDGKTIMEMGFKVDPAKQKIKCGGQYVRAPKRVVVMLNKPKNVVTTASDELGRRTVMDCLKGAIRERVYPAGRLDADSQGMLILTNDGDLCNQLTHPKYQIPRHYHVVLYGELESGVIDKLRKGVWLSEGKTGPLDINIKKRDHTVTVVEVVVREGMNREIRRVFAKFGLKVKSLRRIKIGHLELGNVGDGQFRFLNESDIELLLSGGGEPPKPVRAPRVGKTVKPVKPVLKVKAEKPEKDEESASSEEE